MTSPAHVEELVKDRYRAGAGARAPELCCPVDYDPRYLEAIPREVLERDYGCGDPSKHVRPGETVLDLGSGTGKICFIASQVVGPEGRVIGVDMTREMLDVARAAAPVVAERIGFANVELRRQFFEPVEPRERIPLEEARPFDCSRTPLREPRETKGAGYDATTDAGSCCGPASGDGGCCG